MTFAFLLFIGITWMRLNFPAGLNAELFFYIYVMFGTFLLAGAIAFVYLMLPCFGFPRAFQFLEHSFVSRCSFVSSF